MSPELKELLQDAAREPRRPVDVDDIHRRARRSRLFDVAAVVTVVVLVVGGAAIGLASVTDDRPTPPILDDPADPTPSPREDVPTVSAAGLGAEVFLAVDGEDGQDGHVLRVSPDGSETRLAVGADRPSQLAIVPDGLGGFAYEVPSVGEESAAEIIHVGATGEATALMTSPPASGEHVGLVGRSENGFVAAHRTGFGHDDTKVDLVEVSLDGAARTIAEGVAGWESVIVAAAALETTTYIFAGHAGTQIVVHPPDREPTTVWSGDPDRAEAIDVDLVGSDGAFGLIGGAGTPHLVSIDLFAPVPQVVERIEVPVALGTEAFDVVATELSIHGEHVLVNRRSGAAWLRPLVLNLAENGTWSQYEHPGRALLARPVARDGRASAACAGDVRLRDAAPAGTDALYLYLSCTSDAVPAHAYRMLSGEPRTGDVARDAERALALLLEPLPEGWAQRGYVGLDRSPFSAEDLEGIDVRDVSFADGVLSVDFAFPDGVGAYNTGHGSAVWHTLLAANLLQFDEVEVVKLRESGSCERYSASFEGEGCRRFTRQDAPWNRPMG